ncbi:universal stress protein [Halobiforma nitratireducens]|uniref:UspA domain-containing protein n=1 Tax=Halobiforma nitratireducens JCM 10879 TaxID=1227454 RepID=M0M624_9EURY|nr:universal stress protein [Halobiforma nitratireducens]EMA41146.1 hypothetical protein C446_06300 [Halobiforma nitratireducens JCM 10879]
MTFVVPFDGTALSRAALLRADRFSTVLEKDVVAVTVVPKGNAEYAHEKGWLEDDESFSLRTVLSRVHQDVVDTVPQANFRHVVVDRYASPGTVATRLRRVAREVDASMVFIGSENAGRIVNNISSVGATVAAERTYDVVIVRSEIEPDRPD